MLDHPAQFPDLNSLENFRWAVEKALLDRPLPSDPNDLFDKIKKEWDSYSADEPLKYFVSMPRRMKAVIQGRGLQTRY